MKKIAIVFLLMLGIFSTSNVRAQKGFSWNRVVFGGNFGASFGTYESLVALAPSVGYRFTEKLTLGAGVIYQYYGIKIPQYKINYNFNNYGSRLYGTFQITESLIAHTELESLNLEYVNYNNSGIPDGTNRRTINSWFVGGGYRQYISNKSTIDLMLLYNLNESTYSIYNNPLIRVSFGIGL